MQPQLIQMIKPYDNVKLTIDNRKIFILTSVLKMLTFAGFDGLCPKQGLRTYRASRPGPRLLCSRNLSQEVRLLPKSTNKYIPNEWLTVCLNLGAEALQDVSSFVRG